MEGARGCYAVLLQPLIRSAAFSARLPLLLKAPLQGFGSVRSHKDFMGFVLSYRLVKK